jgi:hypothetical protein
VPDLKHQAEDFARTIQQLLNGTVCDGITIKAWVRGPALMLAGHGLTKDTVETRPFRLRIGQGKPHGHQATPRTVVAGEVISGRRERRAIAPRNAMPGIVSDRRAAIEETRTTH